MAVDVEPLAVVVGRNCKRIRNQISATQDELARYARDLGLTSWKASAVGDFEAGRSTPAFATVLTVTAALQLAAEDRASDLGITVADLIEFDGFVMLTDAFKVTGNELSGILRKGYAFTLQPSIHAGHPVQPQWEILRRLEIESKSALMQIEQQKGITLDELTSILQRSGLAEQRLARQLDIEPAHLAAVSFRLWKRTFTEERDSRAGIDANAQRKGRVARELKDELMGALDGDDQ